VGVRALLNHLLVTFLRLVTRVFFRRIEVSGAGRVPKTGPIVLVGNHPNSLLDPVMIATTCGRRVRMAAKEPLFKTPLWPFLWILGAVPVRRRQDQVKGAAEDAPAPVDAPARVDNDAAFSALTRILEEGDAFAIFPEGISHTRPELAPLKTGAARIVLSAGQRGVPVQIVPCGLSYRRRDRMRSRVLVQYGHPIVLDETLLQGFEQDPVVASKRLTAHIQQALRAQTINAADFETLRVMEGVKTLYRPAGRTFTLAEEAELVRRFLKVWETKKDEASDLRALYADVEDYLRALRMLGFSDAELTGSFSWWDKALRLLRHVFFLAVLVPVAIPGIILHAPVLLAAVAAARTLTDRGDVRATIQMVLVTLATMLTYGVAALATFFFARGDGVDGILEGVVAATSVLAGLILSGAATLKVLDGEGAVRRGLWTFIALLHLDRELETLRHRRDDLRARILLAVKTHIEPGLARLVPEDEHGDVDWFDDDDHAVVA
jgi:1-acyl-sn-glycerol-3-phosphate acyltransferase